MILYYKEWYWEQTVEHGNTEFGDEFSYDRFRYSWYAFVSLLDLDFTSGFACPECGDCPDTVVMDGVSLDIRKSLMPWRQYIDVKNTSTVLDGSSHNTRVFVNNKRARHLLKRYSEIGLTADGLKEIKTDLKLYQPCLVAMIDQLMEDRFSNKCPEVYKDLLLCLASPYPVCGFLHYHEGFFDVLALVEGICYGFQVMEDVESPNIPFTILRTRFHTAPKMVIYDNACNLHVYALNRDPVFFRKTWFVVDRFHCCNHTGCHIGYNLGRYLQHRAVNTQVAEQRNATLKKLKSMLSYMNIDNFFIHLKLFLWFRSMISLAVLDPDLPIDNMPIFKSLSKVYSKMKP